jgi:hypothetical protein
MSYIRFFLALIVLSFAGCQTAEREGQSPDRNIVAGVRVFGSQKYWTEAKIIALKAAVAQVDHTYPIMNITFIDSNTVEVTTGIVRGPLNGEGYNYTFRLKDGRWVTERAPQLPWVS